MRAVTGIVALTVTPLAVACASTPEKSPSPSAHHCDAETARVDCVNASESADITPARLQSSFLSPREVGAKFRALNLHALQPPDWDPHAYDALSDPRAVPSCYGRLIHTAPASQTVRAVYVRLADGAPNRYYQQAQYLIVAAVYPSPEGAAADWMRIQAVRCPAVRDNTGRRIPSKLPRAGWYFRPPNHQTWNRTTERYGAWSRMRATTSLTQPAYVGAWHQYSYAETDYLQRGSILLAIQYTYGTSHIHGAAPIYARANHLLAQYIQRIQRG